MRAFPALKTKKREARTGSRAVAWRASCSRELDWWRLECRCALLFGMMTLITVGTCRWLFRSLECIPEPGVSNRPGIMSPGDDSAFSPA
jgi:hypothetical protein